MKYLSLAMLLMSISTWAQELSCEGGKAHLQRVVEIPGKSAADIYKVATRWAAKSFHGKAQINTVENEMIKGDSYEPKLAKIAAMIESDFAYSFLIEIKEGKMRFTMDNFQLPNVNYSFESYCCKNDGSIRSNSQSQNLKSSVEGHANKLIESFKKSFDEKGDDW